MDNQIILTKLQDMFALSGKEKEMGGSNKVKGIIEELFSNTILDSQGNIIYHQKSNSRRKTMIAGHYDQFGFVVKDIDEKGFLRLASLGYADEKNLLSKQLIIHGTEKIYGICGAKPPHLLKPEDREKPVTIENIIVDTGYSYDEVSKIVSPGDPVTYDNRLLEMLNGNISGGSISSKGVILALIQLINQIKNKNLDEDIFIVFATGRTQNYSGFYKALRDIEPDKVIVLETFSVNIKDSIKTGKGPCILKSPVMPAKLVSELENAAKKQSCQYQIVVRPSDFNVVSKLAQTYTPSKTAFHQGQGIDNTGVSNNDELLIGSVYGNSIMATSLLLPVRNFGTPFELVNQRDIENAANILAGFITVGSI